MSSCEELAVRIQNIDWNERPLRRASQVRLVREYLRRSALWAERFGPTGWPFYDVAKIVDPEVRAPQSIVDETRSSISGVATYYVLYTVEWALHFAHLKDAGGANVDLPGPFDPLMLAYERGDTINYTSAGFIEIDGLSLPRSTREKYAKIPPLADLSEEGLARIDEGG
ncbi:hypothetical protein [Nocardiopsis sp. B62]|uniref:hypothetical protein n=1 Tax=Nocardiopsis sp. B62 TaxID=2824874 RepID=UPI001B379B09|nr:hypothetical protein [Nocardiopsis sp. B62]MBQ1084034.1 hypothetical protein [Nocardiopsis sp. B62]